MQDAQKQNQVESGAEEFRPIFVAIGGNLGDREATFVQALRSLEADPEIAVRGLSPVFETDAVGPGPQPPYLNAALQLRTELDAQALLEVLQRLESEAGRDRSEQAVRWGARPLDLDILFYGAEQIATPTLVVPHPRAHERAFVLRPMAALAPRFEHPVLRKTMSELADLQARSAGDDDSVRSVQDPAGWYLAE